MIEFGFVCPHCRAHDYNDIEIEETELELNLTCASCQQVYVVILEVTTRIYKTASEIQY